jgi:hypothetical protein
VDRQKAIEHMAKAMIKYDRNSMNKTWRDLAKISLEALEEYMGSERYWMSAVFERDVVLREIETTIDRIRNADIPR